MFKFIFYFILFILLLQFILYYTNIDIFDLYDNPKEEISKVIEVDITEIKNSINELKKMNEVLYNE